MEIFLNNELSTQKEKIEEINIIMNDLIQLIPNQVDFTLNNGEFDIQNLAQGEMNIHSNVISSLREIDLYGKNKKDPYFLLFDGLPGSGKSYGSEIAQNFFKVAGDKHLDLDDYLNIGIPSEHFDNRYKYMTKNPEVHEKCYIDYDLSSDNKQQIKEARDRGQTSVDIICKVYDRALGKVIRKKQTFHIPKDSTIPITVTGTGSAILKGKEDKLVYSFWHPVLSFMNALGRDNIKNKRIEERVPFRLKETSILVRQMIENIIHADHLIYGKEYQGSIYKELKKSGFLKIIKENLQDYDLDAAPEIQNGLIKQKPLISSIKSSFEEIAI